MNITPEDLLQGFASAVLAGDCIVAQQFWMCMPREMQSAHFITLQSVQAAATARLRELAAQPGSWDDKLVAAARRRDWWLFNMVNCCGIDAGLVDLDRIRRTAVEIDCPLLSHWCDCFGPQPAGAECPAGAAPEEVGLSLADLMTPGAWRELQQFAVAVPDPVQQFVAELFASEPLVWVPEDIAEWCAAMPDPSAAAALEPVP